VSSLALSGAPVCGMRRLPEGSRRDTGGVSVTVSMYVRIYTDAYLYLSISIYLYLYLCIAVDTCGHSRGASSASMCHRRANLARSSG